MAPFSWNGVMTMTLKTANAPHLRLTERSAALSLDVLIALVPLCVFSFVYYGIRPILLVLTGIATAVICELLCCALMRRKPTVLDGTAAVTGGLVGAMMSPLSPYWLPAIAAAFAILVVKMPFGGTGRNVFNPAAAGLAVVTVCFPGRVFLYPYAGLLQPLPLGDISGIYTAQSPNMILNSGGGTNLTWLNVLQGSFPGPIGATAVAVLLACLLYLFARHTASPLIALPYLVTCALLAALFPRAAVSPGTSVMLEMSAGVLLFSGVFLITDPVTAPRHWLARILYGAGAAVFVMLLRHFGRFECVAYFGVLLANAFSPVLDRFCWSMAYRVRERWQIRRGGGRA